MFILMSGISFPADLVPQIHPINTFNETIVKTGLHVITGNWQWFQNSSCPRPYSGNYTGIVGAIISFYFFDVPSQNASITHKLKIKLK